MSAARRRMSLRRYLRDDSGVSAIEFAIIGPLSFFLVLMTMELGLDMCVDATVQIAAQAASRAGLTTTNPSNGTRAQQAQSIVNTILGGWTNIGATIGITTVNYGTYANIGTSKSTNDAGGLGDVVSYNITLTMPPFTGMPKLVGITQLVFQRNFIVQNEK